MVDIQIVPEVVLTKKSLHRLSNAIDAIGGLMRPDDIAIIRIFEDSILLDTEGVTTMVKLEQQDSGI